MSTLLFLGIYIAGVYMAYFQLQKWADKEPEAADEWENLFMLSLFSWLVYPIYGVMWLTNKAKEG